MINHSLELKAAHVVVDVAASHSSNHCGMTATTVTLAQLNSILEFSQQIISTFKDTNLFLQQRKFGLFCYKPFA
jgi:hypothetical protein